MTDERRPRPTAGNEAEAEPAEPADPPATFPLCDGENDGMEPLNMLSRPCHPFGPLPPPAAPLKAISLSVPALERCAFFGRTLPAPPEPAYPLPLSCTDDMDTLGTTTGMPSRLATLGGGTRVPSRSTRHWNMRSV